MTRRIKVGIAGLGAAGRAFLQPFTQHGLFDLVAVADPSPEVRLEFSGRPNLAVFETLEALLAGSGVDAVLVATPTHLHHPHVCAALASGRHVLVEKPMAARLEQALDITRAAESSGLVVQVGHSHSYDGPIREMRRIVASGALGAVRMVNSWNYTDWVYRPRRPEELDQDQGGGVTFRQGSHQFDIIRYICGGRARSLRARTFDFDSSRPVLGAHSVWIDFEDGAAATAIYNGYGRFAATELCFDIGEWGFPAPGASKEAAARSAPGDENAAKRARARQAIRSGAPHQPFFGLTIVSCEKGDIRQSPQGLFVYTREGRSEVELPTDESPRDAVLAEFHAAVTGQKQAIHDARWGLANLELCLAAIESARTGHEITLSHQVALRD